MASVLPVQRTPFVGREDELRRITELMADPACRLLTLAGPGGIGKTRLALMAASAAQPVSFPNGVYPVFLQPLTSHEYIVAAIADALGYSFRGGEEPGAQLLTYLHGKVLLLVLDNFEHLLEGADLLPEILSAAPGVKLLVTSRERLKLMEEWVLDIGGLQYPALESAEDPEQYSAVKLFVHHACRVASGFELRPAQAQAVIRICGAVGGMPLALELAAVWVRALSCEEIAAEIERGLDLLESSARNAEPRHRTLRAVFEPAWERLSETERGVYRKLSVFRGGFTRDAAEQVAGAARATLTNLVDKSLLRLNVDERYDVHELLRQYAAEQLSLSGEQETTSAAHSLYYVDFLQRRLEDLKGRRQIAAMAEVNADFENVRIAWNHAASGHHRPVIDAMIDAVDVYCDIRGRGAERIGLFQYAEQQFAPAPDEAPTRLWGRLLARAVAGESIGARVENALEIAQRHDDSTEIAYCLHVMGQVAFSEREFAKAMHLLEQSLGIYRRLGDLYSTAALLFSLQRASYEQPWDDFRRYGEESLRIRRKIGDRVGYAWSLSAVAMDKAREGNFVQAEQLWLERIALGHETGNLVLAALGIAQMSHKIYFFLGDFDRTRATAEEALRIGSKLGNTDAIAWAQATLGLLASMDEDYEESVRLCKQVTAENGKSWMADLATWGLSMAMCGRGEFDAAREYLLLCSGFLSTIHGTPGIIGCFPIATVILANRGEPVRAVELLSLALNHPVRGSGWMEKWPLLTRLRADLERTLGAGAYGAAWARGTYLVAETVFEELKEHFRTAYHVAPATAVLDAPVIDETLSLREVEILRLIADGASNREVADRLYLSVETIRWYLKRIYDKLDAHSRVQAISRARALKLLL